MEERPVILKYVLNKFVRCCRGGIIEKLVPFPLKLFANFSDNAFSEMRINFRNFYSMFLGREGE